MDDFAGKISEILNDPESFEKIKSIASLLSSQNDGPAQAKEETNEAQKSPANEMPDIQEPRIKLHPACICYLVFTQHLLFAMEGIPVSRYTPAWSS